MNPFEEIAKGIHGMWKRNRKVYDFYDRLNYRYTTTLFLLLATLVLVVTYVVSDPVSCWVPATFSHEHAVYANRYCWVKNTYFLPFEERIPSAELPRPHIGYYQWVPHILFVQTLLFCLPGYLWRFLSKNIGIDLHMMLQALNGEDCLHPSKRRGIIREIALHLVECLECGKRQKKPGCLMTSKSKRRQPDAVRSTGCFNRKSGCRSTGCVRCMKMNGLCIGKRFGNYLVPIFFLCKIIYLCNSVGQLFLLNYFLGTAYNVYGFDVASDLIEGKDWTETGRFPRVTLCDFKIRQLGGNIHRHTVQCVLYANLLNENIFIFNWFWMVFVSLVNIFGILISLSIFSPRERRRFVSRRLKSMRKKGSSDERLNDLVDMQRFTHGYLSIDGVFVLMLIGRNSNDVITAELTAELWGIYKESRYDEESRYEMDVDL